MGWFFLILGTLAALAFLAIAIFKPSIILRLTNKLDKKLSSEGLPNKTEELALPKWMFLFRKYRILAICIAGVIIIIIASRLMFWLGRAGFIWVMFWIVLSCGILTVCGLVSVKSKGLMISILCTLFAILLCSGIWLHSETPELNFKDIKTITNQQKGDAWAVSSAEYQGGGEWTVKLIIKGAIQYRTFDENTQKYY